jgi:hypothetical protein
VRICTCCRAEISAGAGRDQATGERSVAALAVTDHVVAPHHQRWRVILQPCTAGVASVFPAASVERTLKLCQPALRPL